MYMASKDADDNQHPGQKDVIADRKRLVEEIEKTERSVNELKYKLEKLDFDLAAEKYSKWVGKVLVMSECGEPDLPPIGLEKRQWKYRKIVGMCNDGVYHDMKLQCVDIERFDWHHFVVNQVETSFITVHGKDAFPFVRESTVEEFDKVIKCMLLQSGLVQYKEPTYLTLHPVFKSFEKLNSLAEKRGDVWDPIPIDELNVLGIPENHVSWFKKHGILEIDHDQLKINWHELLRAWNSFYTVDAPEIDNS